MMAVEHSSPFPGVMDIADANTTFQGLQITQASFQESRSHLSVETERGKTLVTYYFAIT